MTGSGTAGDRRPPTSPRFDRIARPVRSDPRLAAEPARTSPTDARLAAAPRPAPGPRGADGPSPGPAARGEVPGAAARGAAVRGAAARGAAVGGAAVGGAAVPRSAAAARDRDGLGKEALYSTAPTSAPTSQVELRCRRCDVPFGSSLVGVAKLLARPFLWDPVRGRLWTRCPACDRRSWLDVRTGQALRVLLQRRVGD